MIKIAMAHFALICMILFLGIFLLGAIFIAAYCNQANYAKITVLWFISFLMTFFGIQSIYSQLYKIKGD